MAPVAELFPTPIQLAASLAVIPLLPRFFTTSRILASALPGLYFGLNDPMISHFISVGRSFAPLLACELLVLECEAELQGFHHGGVEP